jgi:hypothetical protein
MRCLRTQKLLFGMTLMACSGAHADPDLAVQSAEPPRAPAPASPRAGDEHAPVADHGASLPAAMPSARGAARAPVLPQLVNEGGPILRHPRIVPVFFPNDPDRAAVETFVKELAVSDLWATFGREYGIAAPTIGPSVVADAPAPAESNAGVIADLVDHLAARDTAPAGADTIYSLVVPEGTVVDFLALRSCREYLGYHLRNGSGRKVDYAVNVKCPVAPDNPSGGSALDQLTGTTAHELMEAVTNPTFLAQPAFASADADHAAWNLSNGLGIVEVGDMCEFDPLADVRVPGVTHMVQRYWSNSAAAAGKDPCVPSVPGRAYANAALDMPDDVDVNGKMVRGARIPVGETRTLDVRLVSDRADAPPWSVTAAVPGDPTGSLLSFEWMGPSSGKSGDVLRLAITAHRLPPTGFVAFQVASARKGDAGRAFWYGIVHK